MRKRGIMPDLRELRKCPKCGTKRELWGSGPEMVASRIVTTGCHAGHFHFFECQSCRQRFITDPKRNEVDRAFLPRQEDLWAELNDNRIQLEKPFWTVTETAQRLDCSRDFVWQLIQSGKLAAVYDDGVVYLQTGSVLDFMQDVCSRTPNPKGIAK